MTAALVCCFVQGGVSILKTHFGPKNGPTAIRISRCPESQN